MSTRDDTEADLLRQAVALAERQAEAGLLPFAAIVARDGVVVGTGVNTAVPDLDPAAHAEVNAVRDAARRTGTLDLAGATVYASCEPCAICRTVAHAAGVDGLVYAAPNTLIPAAMGTIPADVLRLVAAVDAAIPGFTRRGATGLADERLGRPFTRFAEATSA